MQRREDGGFAPDYEFTQAELTALGVTVTEYDAVGNVTAIFDPVGNETRFVYDDRDRLTSIADPLGQVTRYEYDDAGNLIAVVEPRSVLDPNTQEESVATTFIYDGLNRQIGSQNALGHLTTAEYDDAGNLTKFTDEEGRIARYEYDRRNLLTKAIDEGGGTSENDSITRYTYDGNGNLTTTTRETNAGDLTKSYSYDTLNRRTGVTDAEGHTTTFGYDSVGNLTRVTDPSNPDDPSDISNETAFAYDAMNRLMAETNALGKTRTHAYDLAGNLIRSEDRNGRVREFSYDVLDRLTEERWLNANSEVIRTLGYDYNEADELLQLFDDDGNASTEPTHIFSYDRAGRPTSAINKLVPGLASNVELQYAYQVNSNNLGSVTDFIDGVEHGVESFLYDDLNRVTEIAQSGTGVAAKRVELDYDQTSQLAEIRRYNSLSGGTSVATSTYTYDAIGRLDGLNHDTAPLSDPLTYSYTYDRAHRLTQSNSPDGTASYSYDRRDQLLSAEYEGDLATYLGTETYSYDDNGNRTSDGSVTEANNRLSENDGYTYSYDDEGNLIEQVDKASGEVTTYTWDHRNRLTEVAVRNSNGDLIRDVEYRYDVLDRRVAKVIDLDGDGPAAATSQYFVYDGEHIALVFDESGTLVQRYLHGPFIDQVLAEETADGVRWTLTDHLGSIAYILNENGEILNHLIYDSFGNVVHETDSSVDFRFGFTGRERDEETGLHYYRARYYDPRTGRFLSEDPLGFGAGDVNLYRYVGNSPLNAIDPYGLESLVPAFIVPYGPTVPPAPPTQIAPGGSTPTGAPLYVPRNAPLGSPSNPYRLEERVDPSWMYAPPWARPSGIEEFLRDIREYLDIPSTELFPGSDDLFFPPDHPPNSCPAFPPDQGPQNSNDPGTSGADSEEPAAGTGSEEMWDALSDQERYYEPSDDAKRIGEHTRARGNLEVHFPELTGDDELERHIDDVITNPTETMLRNIPGRDRAIASYDDGSGTIVIENQDKPSESTAFRRPNARDYLIDDGFEPN
ncbi:RHS repeat-associated core domain protein [Rubidibacter lacunae KORDI 51-2]|uniref:RHS repeat-associated core domain protein n=1 Tax=Rubidibacter lacunae KORDI 51-2 TaxID=582515 RepID=U5DJF5_9CHRO|nr:RHS repeat domain-containing protein [Rubidibacter lacunae]ERN39820.1 RHS repeat-associated core domain protein [Rubidibacter lacunae KORDI 51-2]